MKKILITDLDDTLYSWIGFFVPAFYAMVEEVSSITGISTEILLEEYRKVHIACKNVEQPYSTLMLPSIQKLYVGKSKEEILNILSEAFHVFNSVRKKKLKLYDDVYQVLEILSENHIEIIGYTESAKENGYYRLKKMNISQFFKVVYVSESNFHASYNEKYLNDNHTRKVDKKKPSPEILFKICEDEGFKPEEAIYVGDSMTKDIYMAVKANITAVLIKHNADNFNEYYDKLVKISHWTAEDFEKESKLKMEVKNMKMKPDYQITTFKELLPFYNL